MTPLPVALPSSLRWAPAVALVFALVLVYFVYAPGLSGGFMFDDSTVIVDNAQVRIEEMSSDGAVAAMGSFEGSPFGRPVAMASFAINHLFSGLDPHAYKLTNVVIHAINGALVFFFVQLLLTVVRNHLRPDLSALRARWIALWVACAWMLSPLALTSVLYVVQRMTSLAALFSLLTLILYLWGRLRQGEGRRGGWPAIATAAMVTLPLAVLSKENALLVPLFIALAEWLVLRFRCAERRDHLVLLWIYRLSFVAVAVGVILLVLTHPSWLAETYAFRSFTLEERLLTEARVLWFYLRLILVPYLSGFGLFHDDISLSHGVVDPAITLLAVLGWSVVLVGALALRRRAPVFSFGVLFFLAGHLMESSIVPLEIAHEHRNYLPMLGIWLVVGYSLFHPGLRGSWRVARALLAGMWLVTLSSMTLVRAGHWGDRIEHWSSELAYHPNSPIVNYEVGRLHLSLLREMDAMSTSAEADVVRRNRLAERARSLYRRSFELAPDYLAGLFGQILLADQVGWQLDPQVVDTLVLRLRELPLSSHSAVLLRQLARCVRSDDCAVDPQLVDRLYAVALENPLITDRVRAMLLSDRALATYYREGPKASEAMFRKALELDSATPQHWYNYITLLTEAGRISEARAAFGEFKRSAIAFKAKRFVMMIDERLLEAERRRDVNLEP